MNAECIGNPNDILSDEQLESFQSRVARYDETNDRICGQSTDREMGD